MPSGGQSRLKRGTVDLIAHFREARNLVSIQAGVPLFNEGEPGKTMYVLMDGSAAVIAAGQVIEIATPGALLGEMALVDSSTRSATVMARSDCRLLSINNAQFDLLVRESPEFARHVMMVMAGRLRRMNQRLMEAVYSNSTIRDILRQKNASTVEYLS
jgi:CRP/FNR family transcriptional regulator, cyclic AMP receptor protein